MAKVSFKGKRHYQIEEEDEDDYYRIAKKLYGKYAVAPKIAQANPDFEFLKTGAVIELPEEEPEEPTTREIPQGRRREEKSKRLKEVPEMEGLERPVEDKIETNVYEEEQVYKAPPV